MTPGARMTIDVDVDVAPLLGLVDSPDLESTVRGVTSAGGWWTAS